MADSELWFGRVAMIFSRAAVARQASRRRELPARVKCDSAKAGEMSSGVITVRLWDLN